MSGKHTLRAASRLSPDTAGLELRMIGVGDVISDTVRIKIIVPGTGLAVINLLCRTREYNYPTDLDEHNCSSSSVISCCAVTSRTMGLDFVVTHFTIRPGDLRSISSGKTTVARQGCWNWHTYRPARLLAALPLNRQCSNTGCHKDGFILRLLP
jgi:hypothetical protein